MKQSGGRERGRKNAEPQRAMLLEGATIEGVTLKVSDLVWLLDQTEDGSVRVEAAGKVVSVPRSAVVRCPVAAPRLGELRRLDGCFGRPDAHFTEVHSSREHMYRLLRCRKHGRLFLEDIVGGVAMYTRTVLVDDAGEDPDAIWERYHRMSDDWLNHLGIVAY